MKTSLTQTQPAAKKQKSTWPEPDPQRKNISAQLDPVRTERRVRSDSGESELPDLMQDSTGDQNETKFHYYLFKLTYSVEIGKCSDLRKIANSSWQ